MDHSASDNIFLKAAMTGTISSPSTASTNSTSDKSPRRVKKSRISFTDGEDVLIEAAYNHHKGDYKAMVKFIVRHVDILSPKAREYYEKSQHSAVLAKAAEERVRKRVGSKLLQASR